ncbi:GAF domain-containing protein [Phaeobacter italicus]|uniref:GAF domain-containing protein n=3 Tax=Phaeobacter italicus TaxID=481446 RepID=UPI0009E53EF7|nr:GAF domain-containing protein [Phaeobacter italicus]MBY5975700.1 GAF domain-containing protein [Phaeobacter italicus]MBY6042596.1 GAF domain-containing protein [Phaeobacter italicus]MEE2816302.1 GAF domain-containing protein [Pseudomonadota bacterium]GLO74389.1 hypothetical protein MACH18_14690 [Phaeobacter italicus]
MELGSVGGQPTGGQFAQPSLMPVTGDLERLSASSGQEFLQTFVDILQDVLQNDFMAISELRVVERERIQVKAGWMDGENIENFEYDACFTPCLDAIRSAQIIITHKGVQDAYPDDDLLRHKGLESFIGYPVVNVHGEVIGLIQLGWKHQIEEEESQQIVELIADFARRIATELENLRTVRILKALARGPSEPSKDVFRLVAEQVQLLLGVRAVMIAECSQDDADYFKILSYCEGNDWLTDMEGQLMTYEGRPCHNLKSQPEERIDSGLAEAYPHHPRYREANFNAYLGIRVNDTEGEMIGHIVVFNHEGVITHTLETELLSVLRDRLGFEIMRQRTLEQE